MPRGALLTGPPGAGKTTAVKRIVEILSSKGISVSGFYTEERRSGGKRVGFAIVDAAGRGERIMALIGEGSPRVGRYRVDLDAISWGLESIAGMSDVLVIDEVGPMEMLHPDFMNTVINAIKKRPFVLTVHERLVNEVMHICEGRLFRIAPHNRNDIPPLVVNYIMDIMLNR
ncbi:NTPase [Thermocladium modestius]|uniref:NTPase n=1 Tax=Thermocladium modestius TaxID=62609 RepID=A0A830GV96_9CREN|nr:nucleoside-triphosphatase [Thermocladium modestius]GGP20270.1 NTPase [Thermocladium modestius]